MSSLANGFTSRLSNVSLLKMMKTSLSAMHRGLKGIPKFRIENRNNHLHATTPMSSLANGFTSRLFNVLLLKMMKTSLSEMHRG